MSTPLSGSAVASAPVNLVTQTRVIPERDAEFAKWQQQVNDAIAPFPGYLDHQVIPPNPPSQVDWVIIQRFQDIASARVWLSSPERAKLLTQVQPWLVGPDDIHMVSDDRGAAPNRVSAVISTRVKPGQEETLRAWQRRISIAEARFPGYLGTKLVPPIPGVQEDWLTIVEFDNDNNLTHWLDSPERKQLLDESATFTDDVRVRKVRTGFDAWFATKGITVPPAAWKQNMLVLLALYPVVFLFGLLVQNPILMKQMGLPFYVALFIGNAVGVLVLSKLVPWVSTRFNWWLNPTGSNPNRIDLLGAAVIAVLYLVFIAIFSRLA
ncbi:MAG: antibiotic biosynthesis monooxygenase [Thermomicrobiales bacterium]